MLRSLRIVAVLHAISLLAQPILAGMYMSGQDTMIDMHANNSTLLLVLGLALSVLAFLAWRKRLVTRQIFTQAAAIWILEVVQMGFGYSHTLWIHIPLGTMLLAGTAVLMTRLMGPQPVRESTDRMTTLAEVHSIAEASE